MSSDLDRIYDEAARILHHLQALRDEAVMARPVTVCMACRRPTVRGGVCGCDVEAAVALERMGAKGG